MLDGINKSNKDMFLQQLILEEVIVCREANIRAFSRGLEVLDMLSMITGYPHLIRPLMVPTEISLTANLFLSLLHKSETKNPKESKAYQLFISFVHFIEGMSFLYFYHF